MLRWLKLGLVTDVSAVEEGELGREEQRDGGRARHTSVCGGEMRLR